MQHRVSGRVAVAEKPDVVWDRPDLDRLYARLEDEYELKERAEALARKLAVIAETAEVLTDIIDTKRSLRLEIIIVVLIAVELLIAGYQTLHCVDLRLWTDAMPASRATGLYCALLQCTASLIDHLSSRDRGRHDFHDARLQNRRPHRDDYA